MPNRLVCPDSGKRMTARVHQLTVCCPACGQFIRLRADGKLRQHRVPADVLMERQRSVQDAVANWKKGVR